MYVALRQMKEQLEDGSVVTRHPGEALTTFETWPYNNRLCSISSRLVAEVPDGAQADVGALLGAGPNAVTMSRLEYGEGVAPRSRTPVSGPRRLSLPDMPAPMPEAEIQAVEAELVIPAVTSDEEELARILGTEVSQCTDCDYTSPTAAGLKTHRTRKHKAV